VLSRRRQEFSVADGTIVGSDRVVLRSLPRLRVTEGFRTLDPRSHNPVLYQLSYSHHIFIDDASRERAREDSNL
jgi:hypothetical protein